MKTFKDAASRYARQLTVTALLAGGVSAPQARAAPPAPADREWPGASMPLPLTAKTAEDLAFKAVAERAYLLFNLLASGKLAHDAGDFARASQRWEELLSIPNLSDDVKRVVQPLALEARKRAKSGAPFAEPLAARDEESPAVRAVPVAAAPRPAPVFATVRGQVSGSGATGSAGSVVWLKRADGRTPKPKPSSQARVIVQRGKQFLPHVLAVPVGSRVLFRNEDGVFHNVFSLSRPNDFDLGMYKNGVARDQVFSQPGPVSVLCNIHAGMSAHVYVVDSPYYAVADRNGRFAIRNVPPGAYVLEAWHETSSAPSQRTVQVGRGTVVAEVTVKSDRPVSATVPDKAGQPRQLQLGY